MNCSEEVQIAGLIKQNVDDFIVEEIPLYEPCGEGEHLYICIQKTNMSHDQLIRRVAAEFGVSIGAVGYSGRKDLRAVTRQSLSVHLPRHKPEIPNTIGNIKVLSSSWHTNKLRLGHLSGNRFIVRIREIDPSSSPVLQERMVQLCEFGLCNYFGPQRFGNNRNNHKLGLALVLEDWQELVTLLLSGDEHHHKYAMDGHYKQALYSWPFGQPVERNVLESLENGNANKEACGTIPRTLRKLWVNSLQSAMFNKVLSMRVENGTWNKLLTGDLVWNHDGGGRTFFAKEEELFSDDLQTRLTQLAVSPSGPLWGAKMRRPSGEVLELENEVIKSFGLEESHVTGLSKFADGARRPLRVGIVHPNISSGIDEHGKYIQANFDLPAGSYATTLLQQLLHGSSPSM